MATRKVADAGLRLPQAVTPEHKPTASLLELPAEIRTMIYYVVFGDSRILANDICKGKRRLYPVNLNASGHISPAGSEGFGVHMLHITHAIREQAAPIFWGHHTFFAKSSLNAGDLAFMIGSQNARLVRKLILQMWGRKSCGESGSVAEGILDKQSYFSQHVVSVFTGLQDLTINGVFTRKREDIKQGRFPADRRLVFFQQALPHLTNPVIQLENESARLTSPEIQTDKEAKMYDHKKSMQLRKESLLAKRRATIARKRLEQAANVTAH